MKITAMAKVYADLIMKGVKTIGNVPEKIRNEVKQELINRGCPEMAGQ